MSLLLLLLSPAYPLLLLLLSTWCCCCCCWAAVPGGVAGTAVSTGLQPSQPRQGQLLFNIVYRELRRFIYYLKIVILNFFDLILTNLQSFSCIFKPENIHYPRIFQ
jgi:hypothetical protein